MIQIKILITIRKHNIQVFLLFFTIKVRSNFLRSHAKTGPFLPPSRLIARDGDIDQTDRDAPSESKLVAP